MVEDKNRRESDSCSDGQSSSSSHVPLLALGLSIGAYNCLRRAGLHTIAQVAALTDEQFLAIRNLGPIKLEEIRERLAAYSAEPSHIPAVSDSLAPADPVESLPAEQFSVPADTSIDVLGLSIRPQRALKREGVVTLGQLAQIPSERILAIRNIGGGSVAEIEEKLRAYLAEHTLVPPEPLPSLVDRSLLDRVARISLDNIPVERLGLSAYCCDQLQDHAIDSVGKLARQSTETFDPDSPIATRLNRYLTWLAEQDESAWADEATGRGISPMCYLVLAETTLDDLVEQWLSVLDERERLILRWRYGFGGERLTLDAAGERLNLTRERIRQLQSRALERISTPAAESPMWPLVESLRQSFVEVGGLMTEAEVSKTLAEAVRVESRDLEWVGRLVLHAFDQFEEGIAGSLWGFADTPLPLVPQVNQAMVELLQDAQRPVSFDRVIRGFKATGFYREHQQDLDDALLSACLRTNPAIELADGEYALAKWVPEPASRDTIAVQDRGEPERLVVGVKKERQVDDSPDRQRCLDTSDLAEPPGTLADWEKYLVPRVRQVELLGEIPITADECARLGRAIEVRARDLSHGRALRTLCRDCPCAFAVYLVAQGIYGYQGGDYWSEVVQVTGLGSGLTSPIGRAFEQILDELGLPLFYDMRAERAHRYVSLILAHGGIPNYCLPDFFSNMLQPSVLRAQYADMSAAELIDEWQWRSSVQAFTDKPVLRFLAYGGRVAEDFVERCREIAWEYLDSGVMPDVEEIGLPQRVVGAYGRWIAEQSDGQVQRETADRWRLRKPEVLVDPWGEGVLLDLPPQQAPATAIYADIAWQVTAGEEYIVPLRVRRTGFDRKTEPGSISLSQPAEMIQVSLSVDGQVKRAWRYQGVDDERPLLVFDPERGTLLRWAHSLPARRLGLLYPAQLDLRVEGGAQLLEELPRLPWGWSGFRGETWDLSHASRLKLLKDGETVLTVPLQPDESVQRPHLVGGQPLSPEPPGVRAPVYLGPPPSVRVPLSGRRGLEEELARWRLTVRSKWAASPERRTTLTLDRLRAKLAVGEMHVDLPLTLPSLLGDTPCGNYVVGLRGPLGRDAEFTLRILPHLAISGHEALFLPDAQSGPQPVTLLIETSPGDQIEYQGAEDECRVQTVEQGKDGWAHKVEVAPDVTEVELAVVHPLRRPGAGPVSPEDAVRVPISVPIHRLRWTLVGERMGSGRRDWTGRVIKRPVDAMLQLQAPFLLIRLPLPQTHQVWLALRLLDVDGVELQVVELVPSTESQQLWRFDLTAFLDTIRVGRSPILRLELGVMNLPGRDAPLCLPVLSLSRTLLVDDVQLEARRIDDGVVFELRWHEPAPLRNRHVRFWPLWRPWDPVVERSIPDDAEGTWTLDVPPADFRSGRYRVEFLVVDPWVSMDVPEMPLRDIPGTADVELISCDRQLHYLDTRIQKRGECFDLFLERAVICQDAGKLQAAQSGLQWCYQHLDDGTVPQILTLVELAQTAGDPATHRALQLRMFAASRVESLLRAYSQGDVSPDHFRRYLANLPRSPLLPNATCGLLLSVDDETVRLHAAQQLIRRGDVQGVDAVLEWVEGAALSDADAIALLELNAQFSADHLEKRLENPIALRLLEALARELGDRTPVVRPGVWVRTDAGWGRVERIEDPAGHPVEQFISGQTTVRLYVVLRPNADAEPIVVDVARKLISFSECDCIYTCSKCKSFSARDWNLIVNQHDRAAHGGVGPAYRTERLTVRSLRNLHYSTRKPRDELA